MPQQQRSPLLLWEITWAIFWKNCKKYGKSKNNCPSNKGARFARPFCRQFVVLFSYFLQFFQKMTQVVFHSLLLLSLHVLNSSRVGLQVMPEASRMRSRRLRNPLWIQVLSSVVVTCRSRVICKKVASRSGTIGAQSEN